MIRSLLVCLISCAVLAQTEPDLSTVVRRATDYVARYEAAFGNVIATEEYFQTARWSTGSVEVRRSSSDFLIVRAGNRWVGLRDVNTVDGLAIEKDKTSFETLLSNAAGGSTGLFDRMRAESSKYNLGEVRRDVNLPTFALQVLRKEEVKRFSFQKEGIERIGDIQAWRVRFREAKGKTLIRSSSGEELRSSGTLWIEPGSGRVLQTDFLIENRFVKPAIKSKMTVTFVPDTNVGLFVPNVMVERYETSNQVIDCRAEYSDFRAFHVDVKFDFGPTFTPKPPPRF